MTIERRNLYGYMPQQSVAAGAVYASPQPFNSPQSQDQNKPYWLVERICVSLIGEGWTQLLVAAKPWGNLAAVSPPFQINTILVQYCPEGQAVDNLMGGAVTPPQITVATAEDQAITGQVSFLPRLLVKLNDSLRLFVISRNDTAGLIIIQPTWFIQYLACATFAEATNGVV